ncbi:hypothetical protein NESM_000702400 [Novymonas esmeraldas]|uniref:Surface antigen-like protein n=1 Tax=Novymonas esmeraldas TaxID=1808958 RepID=A0AAW0EVJ1_9TRYP
MASRVPHIVLVALLAFAMAMPLVAAQYPCNLAHCTECSNASPNMCSKCELGYVVDFELRCMMIGTCNVQNCVQCFPNDNTRCSTCNSNYDMSAAYTCVPKRRSGASAPAMAMMGAATVVLVAAATVAF